MKPKPTPVTMTCPHCGEKRETMLMPDDGEEQEVSFVCYGCGEVVIIDLKVCNE